MDKKAASSSDSIPFLDILFRTLHYWPWIIASIAICMFFGVFYLLKTPKVYTETASVLIKEDSQGKTAGGNIGNFEELGLIQNNTNIQNEVTTFKSPDLMEEVVKRLDLTMNYYLPGRFHNVVAYGTTNPIRISIPDMPDAESATFDIRVEPDGSYTVSKLKINASLYGEDYPTSFSGVLGDTVRSLPFGPFVVEKSPNYVEGKGTRMEIVKAPLKGTVGGYEGRLGVKLDNKFGTIINLTFSDQNTQRADEVLNVLIGVYNENWIRDKNQIAVSTSNFINDRLNVIEEELGHVDSDISSYKSENAIPDLHAAANSYLAESQQLGQELLDLNNQLQMTRYIKSYLTSDGSTDKALPTNTGLDNLNLQTQITDYNKKLLERNALVTKSSDKNPLVQNMDNELDAMRSAIIGSVDNSILNLQTQMKGIQGARGAATSRLSANPTQAKYLLSVERQQMVKENLYLFLLQKREDNELNQAFTAYNTRIVKRPTGGGPVSPKSNLILMGCFLFGLFVPFGVVYIKEMTDTRVRGRKDVEDVTIPMLGEIPQVGHRKGLTSKILGSKLIRNKIKAKGSADQHITYVKHGKRDSVNEAFRVLRTNVDFTRIHKDGCNVMAITSFNPSSGKSFVTMNLAVSLALKHHKVLVIDGDMRHASASAYIDKPKEGLADYLAGNVRDIDSVLVQYPDVPDFKVLPVGSMPPNPTELLESGRFGEMIEELKKQFDFILIDCPPIEVVADAQIIDKFADRTVFVIRAGLLDRSMLPVLEKLYEEKKFNHMAFILNGTLNEKGRYGYTYSYKYGYGYGYGYGYHSDN